MRIECVLVKKNLDNCPFFLRSFLHYAHSTREKHMPKKKNKNRKPLNLTPAPRLRAYLEAFVESNDRASVTAVVEEALREFFAKRGINTDTPPEDMLRQIIAEHAGKAKRPTTPSKDA